MTKTIQNKSITTIIVITTIIALLGLSSVFITNQEALAAAHPREIPERGYVGEVGVNSETISCFLNRNIPADPLIVNIMPTANGFHTVIMEKEIFDCTVTDIFGSFPVIFQDTLLIQYDDNRNGKTTTAGIKIELIFCDKNLEFTEFGPDCSLGGTPTEFINELDCSMDAGTNEAFVDMDSASYLLQKYGRSIVTYKTVIVEKEIFDCVVFGTTMLRIAEVFTIEETVNGIVQPFKWVVCEKTSAAGIIGCITSDTIIALP